ncbi:DUF2637 domain-containing protein [Streptomyces atratus]|uniref:DUF2637 domain-containing protein n=1 Tax=Streptomyces atratus TaxID=1893 RepID=UPI0021A86BF8|nr:DUF2637 domain-containing protein [Streptomyces atratus]MCT2544307.1 DUF2637 domain-containing protein [Streptomyces atratus]
MSRKKLDDTSAGMDGLLVALVSGAVVVGAVAMAASAATLAELGHAVGWVQSWRDVQMSWSLPVAVDALALVAGAVWLANRMSKQARRLARTVTLAAVLGSIGLNALGHLVQSGDVKVNALLRIGVSTVPPLVAAVVVHLVGVVLTTRHTLAETEDADENERLEEKAGRPAEPAAAQPAAPAREAEQPEQEARDLTPPVRPEPVSTAHSADDGMAAHRYDGMTAPSVLASQPHPVAAAPAAADEAAVPAPAAPVRVPVAPVAPAPRAGVLAPQARTGADSSPVAAPTADAPATAADKPVSAPVASSAPRTTSDSAAFARPADRAPARKDATASVAAAQTAAGRVSARVDVDVVEQEQPAEKAGPTHDWDLSGLPDDCAPGRRPELLTDGQARARIRYGFECEWSQRRVAVFAGRSPSTVHKHMKALESE